MMASRASFFFYSLFCLLCVPAALGQADPTKPNQFSVVFDFEDVAPNCCPGVLPTCGDGKCNRTETFQSCPQDCSSIFCGDTLCDTRAGENCQNCPRDCGACPVERCGNGLCEFYNETCLGCPRDCGECIPCGDGKCSFTEDCDICPQDCGSCDLGSVTGSVIDLVTNTVIPNATLSTFGHKGIQVRQDSNNEGVFYFLRLPPGLTTITATHPAYGGPQQIQVTVRKDQQAVVTIFLAPKLPREEWLVVLRWYATPTDIDLTYFGDFASPPYTTGVVNWETQERLDALPFTKLVYDDRNPFPGGPEIIHIKNQTRQSQNAEIWIHNWAKDRRNASEDFFDSAAEVSLVKEADGIVRTVNISAGVVQDEAVRAASQGKTWWHVFSLTPTNEFVVVNTFHTGSAAMCGFVKQGKAYCPYRPSDSSLRPAAKRALDEARKREAKAEL